MFALTLYQGNIYGSFFVAINYTIQEFNKNISKIQTNDSSNILKNINNISEDRYKISVFLSKLISNFNYWKYKKEYQKNIIQEILSFFKGKYTLKYNLIWDKIFTFLVLCKEEKNLHTFYFECINSINKITSVEFGELDDLKIDLKKQLRFMLHNALVYDLGFNSKIKIRLEKEFIEKIKFTNLFKDYFLEVPIVNFLNTKKQLIDFNFYDLLSQEHNIDEIKYDLSPRNIKMHELFIYNFFNGNSKNLKNCETLYNDSYKKYYSQFYSSKYNNTNSEETEYKKYHRSNDLFYHKLNTTKIKKILRIGIANIKVNESNIENNVINEQNHLMPIDHNIYKILNEAKNEKIDMLIFPEISIPLNLILQMIRFSKKHNIAIIGGIEHFNRNDKVYNYLAAILPEVYDTFINFRLKKAYSPEETLLIEGNNKKVPYEESKEEIQNIFIWLGAYFSLFNCFELTDIQSRGLLRGKIDVLFASVFNRDLNYFEDILDSTSRDLHCYAVQVNASQYGDSKIVQPKKQYEKDILKIKGGENASLLVGEINIDALRSFQLKNHLGQKNVIKGKYKYTPPGLNTEDVKKRKKMEI